MELTTLAPVADADIHTYAERAYLDYALAVVKGRGLPDVRDGNKIVHRRTLYTMDEMGLWAPGKPVKSAKIIGQLMGNYHPHGDSACYESMVRQTQDFTLRYPLVDGQGNFGSRDGDGAAAMRYTEARLMPIAALFLSELHRGTVDFTPNYDGSETEPTVLPARLPFVLLNGTDGIAVGMATKMPSHNLREVAGAAAHIIEHPDATLEDLLHHIKGPDFPGGGQVTSSPTEIAAAYRTGNSPLRCRGRWVKEELARGQWQIVITELPFQVSATTILSELEELTNPTVQSGRKELTQEQVNRKKLALDLLEGANDESSRDAAVRLVLSPRTSKVDVDALMAFMLAYTSLEQSVSYNATMIGLDGRPATKGLVAILSEWATFRLTTVRRRCEFDLAKAMARIHILEGRQVVFLNLDAVIAIIRASKQNEAKDELMSAFGLSEIQATDILNMRLGSLSGLESIKLEKELGELRSEAAGYEHLLGDDAALRALVVSEIHSDAAKYGDDRRTLLQQAERITASETPTVVDEPVTVVLTRNRLIKAYRGHGIAPETFAVREGDAVLQSAETRTVDSVHIFDSRGRIYSVAVSAVPTGRGEGSPLSTFVDIQDGAAVVAMLYGTDDQVYLVGGMNGNGFLCEVKNLSTNRRVGRAFLTLEPSDKPFQPVRLPARGDDGSLPGYILCASTEGRMVAYSPNEINFYTGGVKGVGLMSMDIGYTLSSIRFHSGDAFSANIDVRGQSLAMKLEGDEWSKHVGRRNNKGCFLPKKGILQ